MKSDIQSIRTRMLWRLLLKAAILYIPVALTVFALFIVAEYFFYLSSGVRFFLYLSALGLMLTGVFAFVILTFRLDSVLTRFYRQYFLASDIAPRKAILNYINLIYLKRTNSLLSIKAGEQVEKELKARFVFFKTRKLAGSWAFRIGILWFILLVGLSFSFTEAWKDPLTRILNYNRVYSKSDLLQYAIEPRILECRQGEDFILSITFNGNIIPDKMFIVLDNHSFPMVRTDLQTFQYTWHNLQNNLNIVISNPDFDHQKNLLIKVNPVYNITKVRMFIQPPSYSKLPQDTLYDLSYVKVLKNSKIVFHAEVNHQAFLHTYLHQVLENSFQNDRTDKFPDEPDSFVNKSFTLLTNSKFVLEVYDLSRNLADSLSIVIEALEDRFPEVLARLLEKRDTTWILSVSSFDDFEITQIGYQITGIRDGEAEIIEQNLLCAHCNTAEGTWTHLLPQIQNLDVFDTVTIQYFAKDNYFVKGQETGSNKIVLYTSLSFENKIDQLDTLYSLYRESDLNMESIRKSKKALDRMQADPQNLENFDALQVKDQISVTVEKFQEDIERIIHSLSENHNTETIREESLKDAKRLLNQLDSLGRSIENLNLNTVSDIRKLMDELQKIEKLMNLSKEKAKLELDEERTDLSFEKLMNDIDLQQKRNDELAKELKKRKEGELPEKKPEQTLFDNNNIEYLQHEHERITDQFNQLNNEMNDQLLNSNQGLTDSLNQIQEDYNGLDSETRKEEKLGEISRKYERFQESLQNSMMELATAEQDFDFDRLKMFLSEGIRLSKRIEETGALTYIPAQKQVAQQKAGLKGLNDFTRIWPAYRDSLLDFVAKSDLPLSFFTEQTFIVDQQLNTLKENLRGNQYMMVSQAANETMAVVNKIVLMLSEVLNTQEESDSQMEMAGQCKMPKRKKGGKKPQPSLSEIMKRQQKMSEQAGKKQGNKPQKGNQGTKELLEMINQQYELRMQLKELLSGNGESSALLNEIGSEMKRLEEEMVKNNLMWSDIYQRQKQITQRLLEAEKAHREQEWDDKRVSEESDLKWIPGHPTLISPFQKENNIEILKPQMIKTRNYYSQIMNNYFIILSR